MRAGIIQEYSLQRKARRKPIKRSLTGNFFLFTILIIMGIYSALPFIYAIVQSLKPLDEIFVYPPRFLVNNPTMDNFYLLSQLTKDLWVPFSRYVFNSVSVSLIATLAHLLFSSMAAFPLAKYRFPGAKTINTTIVWSLLFTGSVTQIPCFILMSRIGLLDTYWALILPPIQSSLGLFLMRQFMTQIPNAVIEAATVDGAGIFRIYYSICMPSVKPAWLTLIIFSFQAIWNNSGNTYIYNESLKMLPTVLHQITSSGISRTGAASAAAVILMLPPIIVFMIAQSNVIETMAHSGIKE